MDLPTQSLGRLHTPGLFWTRIWRKTILQHLSEGQDLSKIDSSQLPGKYKVWCYHFNLSPRMMWRLKPCEVTASAVSRMEAKADRRRLVMELRDSSDRAVTAANARIVKGRPRKSWAWSRQGGQASDGTTHPSYGPRQAERKGRTWLLLR